MNYSTIIKTWQPAPALSARNKNLALSRMRAGNYRIISRTPGVEIIGAAWDIGVPVFGSSLGPLVFDHHSQIRDIVRHPVGLLKPVCKQVLYLSDACTVSKLRGFCLDVAHEVSRAVRLGKKIAVIGGDHSCAIGTWHGMADALGARKRFGLIWIDAHLDAHTPQTSLSGRLHGMPLATLLGHGHASLTGLLADAPVLDPRNVAVIGVRNAEQGELELLQTLGVRIYFMAEVEQRGLGNVLAEARRIATAGSRPFGVTVDLDAIDPRQAPGVNTPEVGGLHNRQLTELVQGLYRHKGFLGVEIAEYNPLNDCRHQTLRIIGRLFDGLLPGHFVIQA